MIHRKCQVTDSRVHTREKPFKHNIKVLTANNKYVRLYIVRLWQVHLYSSIRKQFHVDGCACSPTCESCLCCQRMAQEELCRAERSLKKSEEEFEAVLYFPKAKSQVLHWLYIYIFYKYNYTNMQGPPYWLSKNTTLV